MTELNKKFKCEMEKHEREEKNMKSFYDNWAKEYENVLEEAKYNSICHYVIEKLVEQFGDESRVPQARVLDIACGTGLIGVILQKYGFKNIVGFDANKSMLEIAEKKNIYEKLIEGLF